MEPVRRGFELIAKAGMRDPGERQRSLSDAAAEEVGDPVLGNHELDVSSCSDHACARLQLRNDT